MAELLNKQCKIAKKLCNLYCVKCIGGGYRLKKLCLLFLLIASLFLNACANNVNPKLSPLAEPNRSISTEHVGYITKIENQRALVVSPISKEINQTRKEFYDAVWVSNMPPDIEVGQSVHVWFDGEIATSYPAQGKASKVTNSNIKKPEKADFTQDTVIRKALLNKDISSINVIVIKEVSYDEYSDVWTIRYKDAKISDGLLEEHSMQVPDK
jgi:hypothetical protein